MPRKPEPHNLPPLGANFPDFGGFAPQQNARCQLAAILMQAVHQMRGPERRPFYSQREIARFFRVPLRTVTLACRQLTQQGLLVCVRGAGTWITGTHDRPRVMPLGVVGMPVWASGFSMFRHWRRFVTQIEEQVRSRGFVLDVIFCEGGEEIRPAFADRLLAHDLDHLFWLYPLPSARGTVERLIDAGVRVRTVVEKAWSAVPFPQYLMDWESSYVRALKAWQQAGIDHVVALGSHQQDPEMNPLHRALLRTGMRHDYRQISDLLRLDSRDAGGVIIPDDLDLFMFSRLSARNLVNLMARTRVMIKNGLMTPQQLGDVSADVIRAPWGHLARRLADDLAAAPSASPSEVRVVKTEWLPHQAAAQFSHFF